MSRILSVLAFALPLAAGAATAQSTVWIEFPAGANYNLVQEEDGRMSARIPATYAAVASMPATGLQARVLDVVYKEGRSEKLASQFSVDFVKPTATSALAVVVRVKESDKVLPGTYVVSVQVDADLDGKNAKPQVVVLTLQRPAPQVATSPSVIVGQIQRLVGADTINVGSLRLAETSGKAAAAALALQELRDPLGPGQPDSGTLVLPKAPIAVPAGGVKVAEVGASGVYPLGKTTGKIEVRSAELTAPVLVNYEVRARRELWMIAAVAALGAAIGWAVRVFLAPRQALLAAATIASEVIGLIRKELDASEDATYRRALEDARKSLDDLVSAGDAAKITAEAKTATEEVVSQRAKLEQRLAPLMQAVEALHAVLDIGWKLPRTIADILDGARDELANAKERIHRRDADGAKEAWSHLSAVTLPGILDGFNRFGADLGKYLAALVGEGPPASAAVRAQLQELADAVAAQFPTNAPQVKTTTPDDVRTFLAKGDALWARSLAIASAIPLLTRSFIQWAREELEIDGPETDATFARVSEESFASADVVREEIHEPEVGLLRVADRSRALKDLWITTLKDKGVEESTEKIQDALRKGLWTEVVTLAANEIAPRGTQAGGPDDAGNVSRVPADEGLPAPSTRTALAMGNILGFGRLPALAGTAAERRELASQSKSLAALQSAIFGVLFIIGVYVLYSETWVGTGKEMLALLVLAFGVDLTSDSVLGVFKKLKLPEL